MHRFIAVALFVCAAGAAQAEVPCANMSGNARTRCLEASVKSSQENLRKIEQHNRNLDRAIGAAQYGDKVLGAAAGAAGGVTGGPAGSVAGTGAYEAGKAAGTAIYNKTRR